MKPMARSPKIASFGKSDHDRAILESSAGGITNARKMQMRRVGQSRRDQATRSSSLGVVLHRLPETAGEGAAVRGPAEVSLLE